MALFQLKGSLRIGNGLGFGAAEQAGLTSGERPPYTESLVKLFPAEGVGLTTLVVGLGSDLLPLSIVLAIVIAAGVFVLRVFATKPANGGKTERVEVQLGLQDPRTERVQIVAGLNEGDLLLRGAAQGITPGTPAELSVPQ